MFRRRCSVVWLVLTLGSAGSAVWWYAARPAANFRQAQREFDRNPQRAAELLEQAVMSSGGDYPAAQLLWTRALLRTGRWEEALGCFSYIRQPTALDADELFMLADEALAAGVPLLAAFALNAIPERSPKWIEARERQLRLLYRQRDWPRLILLGTELTAAAPRRADTWQLLAEAYERLMNPPQAASAYRHYLELEEDSRARVPALRRLVQLSIDLGDRDDARRRFQELTASVEPTVEDQLLEARLYRLEGDIDAAWQSVERILAAEADFLAAKELRGALALDLGNLATAQRDLEAVLQEQPWNKQAHYRLAQVLRRIGRNDEARAHFDENRRLTDISLRILELQQQSASGQAEINRLHALAAAFDQLGQRETAEAYRSQARRLTN